MNKLQNQFSNSRWLGVFCLAIGLTLATICQQSVGQSAVTPVPLPKRVAALQAEISKLEKQVTVHRSKIDVEIEMRAKVEQDYDKLKKIGSKLGISEESYPEILKTLHSQRVQLSIDLAGIDARYAAIETAIKNVSMQGEAANEPFKRLVELREKEFERTKSAMASGKASVVDLQNSEIELLQARMQMSQASKPSSSLSRLNSQLLDSSLERAEKTARLEKAQSLFEEVDAYLDHAKKVTSFKKKIQTSNSIEKKHSSDIETVENRITILKQNLAELTH